MLPPVLRIYSTRDVKYRHSVLAVNVGTHGLRDVCFFFSKRFKQRLFSLGVKFSVTAWVSPWVSPAFLSRCGCAT